MSAIAKWEAERIGVGGYIGASDAATVLGLNPHQSAHDLWLVKTGQKVQETSFPMRRGHAVESEIAREFSRTTGMRTFKSRLYRHHRWPFLGCNPDRELRVGKVRGLLECKDVGYWPSKQWGKDGADQVPEMYLIQVAHQLIVTGFKFVCLYACIDGRECRPYFYTFEPAGWRTAHVLSIDFATKITKELVTWWDRHIVHGIEPEMSYHEDDHRYCQERKSGFNGPQKPVAYPDEDLAEIVKLFADQKAALDRAQAEHDESKNKIKLFMAAQGADSLETELGYFNYKTDTRGIARFTTPFKSDKA